MGASIAGAGGNLDTYDQPTLFGPVSIVAGDQPEIRYTSGGVYEIKMPGADWAQLVHYGGLQDPSADNNYFQPQNVQTNYGYLATTNSRNSGYSYSEFASWGSKAAGRRGYMAFGTATSAGDVPVTGSATFTGSVMGTADIMVPDGLYGGYIDAGVSGTVGLNFNFATGTLDGSTQLFLSDSASKIEIGTFAFTDTVFSVGSGTYSGRFATNAAGDNFFLGQFTGPNAEETIGSWTIPFVFSAGTPAAPADNQVHQAFGAWIARRP